MRPRRPRIESQLLRNSIKGLPCFLNLPTVCSAGPNNETVVPCHAPSEGKGWGVKSDDIFVVAGCHACHQVLDRVTEHPLTGQKITAEEAAWYWLRGMQRQVRWWHDNGYLVIVNPHLLDAGRQNVVNRG